MGYVFRTFACPVDHRWSLLVERGSPPPDECPICQAIVEAIPPTHAPAPARSDTIGAPLIRSERGKAVQRFENVAFKKMSSDDERILPTNMRDNVKAGETYAIPETPSTNSIMATMKENIERAEQMGGRETEGGRAMMAMGGGWGAPGGPVMNGLAPSNPIGRPTVDLQGKRSG